MICSKCKKQLDSEKATYKKIKTNGIEINNIYCPECASLKKTAQINTTPKSSNELSLSDAGYTILLGVTGSIIGAVLFSIISIISEMYYWYAGFLITAGALILIRTKVKITNIWQKILIVVVTTVTYLLTVSVCEAIIYAKIEDLVLLELNPINTLISIPFIVTHILIDFYHIFFLVVNILVVLTLASNSKY